MIKNKKFKKIAVEKIPNSGFGQAINDRLNKGIKILMEKLVEVKNLKKNMV